MSNPESLAINRFKKLILLGLGGHSEEEVYIGCRPKGLTNERNALMPKITIRLPKTFKASKTTNVIKSLLKTYLAIFMHGNSVSGNSISQRCLIFQLDGRRRRPCFAN